jgi:hypothetical protein
MISLAQPASPLAGKAHYQSHQPERTLLYQLVERHYPTFCYLLAKTKRPLPDVVQQEFEAVLKCGRGSALNLNIYLMCREARMSRAHGCAGATHMLFLDGIYASNKANKLAFK